jgi:hypothetical protein
MATLFSREVFARQFAYSLAQKHCLIALDPPGHGLSGDALDPVRSYPCCASTGSKV